MLTPITSEIRDIDPIAYDLEWYPKSYRVRLVGVFDHHKGYRSYRTVQDFLNAELSHANRGRTFFAHAGGSFDVQHILECLRKNTSYECAAHFSGAAAMLVHVLKGKHKWTFADSYFLLPDSLKKIGKTIGLEKGECSFSAPIRELTEYNRRDCEIVLGGLTMLQEGLRELGGQMKCTLAASCMNLFRRSYLKREIETSESLNDVIRPSYCASRVEVFGRHAPVAEYWDINSSFPASMTRPQPGNLRSVGTRIPRQSSPVIWFADCDISVPESYLPPLPCKMGQRIFFPWGKWRGIFTQADIRLLERTGGRIEKVYRVWSFDPFEDLADYVYDIYAKKLAAEKEGDPFKRFLFKRVLVSLYGKFGERTTKDTVLINPDLTTCPHKPRHKGNECIQIISPGIYRLTETRDVEHAHVPISSYTTSLSRELLYEGLEQVKTLYMCDTDSNVCGEGERLREGDGLGEWKHEGTIRDAKFLCPKVYAFTGACDACKGKGCPTCKGTGSYRTVKSKGFRRMTGEDFEKLARFEPVKMDRTRGIKEGLRDEGRFGMARSKVRKKRLHENTLPKRKPMGNGSRAWHVDEISIHEGE